MGGGNSITSPFKYNRSNAKRHTRTLMSSTLTSLRFRLLSSWKGINFPVSRSIATASASRTKDLVDSLMHWRNVSGQGSPCSWATSYFRELFDQVGIFLAHVFRIPTENAHGAVFEFMDLI